MPSVLTPATLIDYIDVHDDYIDVHDLPTTPSRARGARRGFWRTLVQHVAWPRVRKTYRRPQPYAISHRLETPIELLARQYPTLYLQACLGV
jgi:hypothetical protein